MVYCTYDSVTLSWTPIYIAGTQPPVIDQSISYEVNFAVYQDGMDLTHPENLDLTNFQRIVLSNPQIDSGGKITFKVGNLNSDTRYVFS